MSLLVKERFLPIAVKTLFGVGSTEIELYAQRKGMRPALFRARSAPISVADIERLVASGIRTLLIRPADLPAYEKHLQEQLALNERISLSDRYCLLTEATRTLFENALQGGVSDSIKVVNVAEQFGGQLADAMCQQKPILRDMFELMLHDYYTFTHAANVSTYCVFLAQALGISDRKDLARIATGGLLHDIGKRHIPRYVLNKTNKLTDVERADIQRHAQLGFEELTGNPKLDWQQLMMVYQHHERLEGRGYPVGIDSDEIDPWAKICAVADVFDALTCDRPHRKAITSREAYELLERQAGRSFDAEIVRCLKTITQPN